MPSSERVRAEVDGAGRRAARGVAPDPRPSRARLRGALRPRPADRRSRGRGADGRAAAPTGSRPRSSPGPATEGPTIAVLCEYDALPGIGHACGHNIIATAGLGAGLAAAALADEAGRRVLVLGTPAEEGGGGKVLHGRAGAFDGVDAAMMVHPAAGRPARAMDAIAMPAGLRRVPRARRPTRPRSRTGAATRSTRPCSATSTSPPCASTSAPPSGSTASSPRRATSPTSSPTTRGPVVRAVRHASRTLEPLKDRVLACLEAGARRRRLRRWRRDVAYPAYADMLDNAPMLDLYRPTPRGSAARSSTPTRNRAVVGSTDMGNVSYRVPSIHPMIRVAPRTCPSTRPSSPSCRGRRAGRPGRARRGQGDGHDGGRPVAAAGRPRRRAAPSSRRPWRESADGARRSAAGGPTAAVGSPPLSLRGAVTALRRRGVHARRGRRPPARTSPTSTGRCSPWSTCPRWSRAPCSPATPGRRRACAGCSSTSSSASSTSPATPPSTPPSACAGPRSSTTGSSSSTATTRSPSSAACTSRASRRPTCSPRSSSGAG